MTDTASPAAGRAKQPPRGALARYFNPYRLAAYALALYAIGHTLGAVVQTPQFNPAGDAVAAQMKSVHLIAGTDTTWYGLFRGLGGTVSVYLVFSMVVCWCAGGLDRRNRRMLAPILWALLASQAAGAIVAFVYLFSVPIVFSLVIALLVGLGCVRDLLTAPPAASLG